jgi:hypothetical protein
VHSTTKSANCSGVGKVVALIVYVEFEVPALLKLYYVDNAVLPLFNCTHIYSLELEVDSACPFAIIYKLLIVALLGTSAKATLY